MVLNPKTQKNQKTKKPYLKEGFLFFVFLLHFGSSPSFLSGACVCHLVASRPPLLSGLGDVLNLVVLLPGVLFFLTLVGRRSFRSSDWHALRAVLVPPLRGTPPRH